MSVEHISTALLQAQQRGTRRKHSPWKEAALMKDRTRRAIRDRRRAGEDVRSLADDYDVPAEFIRALGEWLCGDEQ